MIRAKGALLAVVAAATAPVTAVRAQNPTPPSPGDLAIIAPAYAEGIADVRSFLVACAASQPADWEDGAASLVSSFVAAGLDAAVGASVAATLARPPIPQDCADETAAFRGEFDRVESWITYHRDALGPLGIRLVEPQDADDPRLAAARAALASHAAPQAMMLSCMALVAPQMFPVAFADWDDALDRAEEGVRMAGFPESTARDLIAPSRSAALFKPAEDRAQTTRDCVSDQSWLNRYGTFFWYTVTADVKKAVGVE